MLHNWILPPCFLRNRYSSLAQKSAGPTPLPGSLGGSRVTCHPRKAPKRLLKTHLDGLPSGEVTHRGHASACTNPAAHTRSASGEQDTRRFYCLAGFCSTRLFSTIEFAAAEAAAGPARAPAPPSPLRWDRDLVSVAHVAPGWVIQRWCGRQAFAFLLLSILAWSDSLT